MRKCGWTLSEQRLTCRGDVKFQGQTRWANGDPMCHVPHQQLCKLQGKAFFIIKRHGKLDKDVPSPVPGPQDPMSL